MENFINLHKKTVDLLTSKTANYALPPAAELALSEESRSKANVDYVNESGDLGEKDLGADELYSCISEIYDNEKENVLAGIYAESEEVAALQKCADYMRLLKERYDTSMKTLNELRSDYDLVTERTSSLHNACDRMMAHQTQLAAGAEQIRANLYYYTQCDSIMKKLNTGRILINGKSFTQILATIDECLTFLREHIHYKDSAAYVEKYNQCLSKAMTAIRVGVLADLEASVNAVRDRQAQLDADAARNPYADEDTFALVYGVFAGRANSVRSALTVAEQRFADVPEFQSMAADCQNAYFAIRQQLLTPILNKTIEQLLTRHTESSCALTRNGCAFLLRMCDDEFRLFKQFFNVRMDEGKSPRSRSASVPSSPLAKTMFASFVGTLTSFDDFIESICRVFYDVLRPIVVHNPHLETLAELCTILKVEMIEERCGLMMSVMQYAQGFDTAGSGGTFGNSNEEAINPRTGFVRVMSELVGDVAERIVYRASLYGQSDILGFRPSPGDLAYPEKLIMMKNIEKEHSAAKANVNGGEKSENVNGNGTTSAIDLHCLWYPTVRRTVLCLSKLYRCLDSAVFQSIARDLLSACCESLEKAAEQIRVLATQKTSRSRGSLDAELFIVKHLLILREQTSPYRASTFGDGASPAEVFSQRDYTLDFSKYKTSASQLLQNRQRWFELNSNNAFLELLFQVPISVSESLGDSRRIIDAQLKHHCHGLIKVAADMIIFEFADFMTKLEASIAESGSNAKENELLKPSNMQDAAAQAFRKLTHYWPEIKEAFNIYIGAKDAEDILLQAIRKQIVDVFAQANAFVEKFYDEEQRQIAGVPAQEQVWLVVSS